VKWTTWISRRPCIRSNGLGFFLGTLSLYTSRLLHQSRPLFSEAAPSLDSSRLACMYGIEKGINGFAGLRKGAKRVQW
jgi:hypothetical protein